MSQSIAAAANNNNNNSEQDDEFTVTTTSTPPDKPEFMVSGEDEAPATGDDPMDVESAKSATVFCIRLKQPPSNLLHKMSVPELCRTFRLLAFLLYYYCCCCVCVRVEYVIVQYLFLELFLLLF